MFGSNCIFWSQLISQLGGKTFTTGFTQISSMKLVTQWVIPTLKKQLKGSIWVHIQNHENIRPSGGFEKIAFNIHSSDWQATYFWNDLFAGFGVYFVLTVFSELSFCEGATDICKLHHNAVAYIATLLIMTTTTIMENKNQLELVSKKRGGSSVLSCINMRSSGLCIRRRTCPLAFFERGQYCPAEEGNTLYCPAAG